MNRPVISLRFPWRLIFLGLAILGALSFSRISLAACTPTSTEACLANQPIQSTSVVKPNVMFILDNSGSMTWTYMPDVANNFHKKYGYQSNQCNGVYYNPDITYVPPKNATGGDLPNAVFTAARDDGFDGASTPRNLDNGFIANRFTPESANTTYASSKSYLGNGGSDSLGPYSAVYYLYTGAVTTKDYLNTSSTFYTECNTALSSASAVFAKRRLATTETTTIVISGSSSTSVQSIKVNGVELMSGATANSSNATTLAGLVAAKITRNGFSAVSSGSVVTITGPNSAANYTPLVTKSGSMTFVADVFPETDPTKLTNFANWYTYYRTRILMMKSGMSTAFSTIDDKIRVGFHTINNPGSGNASGRSLNIDDFAATQKNAWYSALWSIAPSGGTPLQIALSRVGNYYANSGTRTGLTSDPVQYSCQKNFAILSTDGFWNGGAPTGIDGASIGNMDRTVPSTMPIKAGGTVYDPLDTGLTAGQSFPRPYYEGGTASSGSLADVAMYYWVKDLRTNAAQSVIANNVAVSAADPAYWQHMNTFTVGLGVDGSLSYPSDLANIQSGSKDWPQPVADNLKSVDDLWHAAVNGRGQYYRATDPVSLSNSLNAALTAVTDTPSFGVGPSSSTSDLKSPYLDDYTTYVSSYRIINWSGDVQKFALDRRTGMKTGNALWSAGRRLDEKVNPGLSLTSPVNPTAYTTRKIVTRNELGAAVEFVHTTNPTATTMSAAQLSALCYKPSPGTGACVDGDPSLINYLRGDASWEGNYGDGTSRFRNRHDTSETTYYKRDLIGSIVNSQPAYVAAEQEIYQDVGYADFKVAVKNRTPMVYVGANDGMLHALNATTGDEVWAYIPSFLIPLSTDEEGKEKGLRAVSYQNGGAPAFKHHFYLDGPLEVGPVDFNRTGGPNPIVTVSPPAPEEWRTILVGGLGKGGKGYFALDVTNPPSTISDAKAKVLWEFPNKVADPTHASVVDSGLMGYSFGRPVIAKTQAWGWVVMVPSGYNNSDGYGYLFVLNAKNGRLLETLKTPIAASGMANITVLARSNNKYVKQAYAGDLDGNIWRFEFVGETPAAPRVTRIFSSSSSTPIATEVNVSIDGNNGDRWVFFGTGRYLDVPDRSVPAGYQQYIGALRDGSENLPRSFASPVQLASLTNVTNLLAGVQPPAVGWKFALPTWHPSPSDPVIGERNAMAPVADLRTVVFVSLIPTTDPCSPGLTGNAYALDYSTGKTRLMEGSTPVTHFHSDFGIASATIQMGGKTSASSGTPQLMICGNDGTCVTRKLDVTKLLSGTRHVGWRELLNEY